jgi:hypothetical protein
MCTRARPSEGLGGAALVGGVLQSGTTRFRGPCHMSVACLLRYRETGSRTPGGCLAGAVPPQEGPSTGASLPAG